MNIDHLRDFLCVAETFNLTLAADRRNTTPPNLGKRLRALEEAIGAKLIDTTSRPLSLTRAGEEFVPIAYKVVSELDGFRGALAPWSPSEGGITIVMPHSATVATFPRFKEWLSHRMANVWFAPTIANHDTAGRLLSKSKVDLAMVTHHPLVPQDDIFSVFRHAEIGSDRLVIVETPSARNDEALPLHVSHPQTYIGRIWQACRCELPVSEEFMHGMAADIRTYCLTGRARGVVPISLVESDLASGQLKLRDVGRDMSYAISLFCSSRASSRARRVWSLAAQSENVL